MRRVKLFIATAVAAAGLVAGGANSLASAATVPSCAPSQMSVRLGQTNGTAGTIYYAIVFTDTGGRCVIWGVPHIQPVSGAGHVAVGPAAGNASMGQMPVRHTLSKGKSVSVDYGVVESGNYPASTCVAKNASGVLVSLMPFVKSTYLKLKISVCTKRVSTNSRLLSPGTLGY